RVPMYPAALEYYFKRKKRVTVVTAGVTAVMSPILFKYSKKSLLVMLSGLIATAVTLKYHKLRQNTVKLILRIKIIGKGHKQRAEIFQCNDLMTLVQGVICTIDHGSKLVYGYHEVQTDRTGYKPDTIKLVEESLIKFADETIVENKTREKKHDALYG